MTFFYILLSLLIIILLSVYYINGFFNSSIDNNNIFNYDYFNKQFSKSDNDLKNLNDYGEYKNEFITRADCNTKNIYCLSDSNCKFLCKNTSEFDFICDKKMLTCVLKNDDNNSGGEQPSSSVCNDKIGELAVLVGYTSIGTVKWECINLYPAWADKKSYCENGIIDYDIRIEIPSTKHCKCPEGTYKIVNKLTDYNENQFMNFGNLTNLRKKIGITPSLNSKINNFSLPHCVKFPDIYGYDWKIIEN